LLNRYLPSWRIVQRQFVKERPRARWRRGTGMAGGCVSTAMSRRVEKQRGPVPLGNRASFQSVEVCAYALTSPGCHSSSYWLPVDHGHCDADGRRLIGREIPFANEHTTTQPAAWARWFVLVV
jgi:hypothetical protein